METSYGMIILLVLIGLGVGVGVVALLVARKPKEYDTKSRPEKSLPEGKREVSLPTAETEAPVPAAVPEPKKKPRTFGKAIASWIPLLREQSKDRDRWEEVLIGSDMGPRLAMELLDELEASEDAPETFFKVRLKRLLSPSGVEKEPWKNKKPWVLYMVGVNGVGKTTSVVKLGSYLKNQGLSVGVVGADTFRKAAIEQLERQCDKLEIQFFTRRAAEDKPEGVDPSSVIFDGLEKLKTCDVILVDTSGRLHTKKNLMEELKKMQRVGEKVIPEAPHDIWLVIDATLGQNALSQAEVFNEAVQLTGLVLTKMDGLSRGGIIFQIFRKLGCPIWFMGLGEQASDLERFDPEAFVESLFETN